MTATDSSTSTPNPDDATSHDDVVVVGRDGESFPIVELLTGRGFITGKSGSGKSNTASVFIEELLEAGYPCLIVDTDGEYYGLKTDYEILHVGADEECDLQVAPEHAGKIAELALEKEVPVILDISAYFDPEEANAMVRETARELFVREKGGLKKPFLLIVEEAHEFIPEQGSLDDTAKVLIQIGKRGRKHGLGMVGISQRPANVKKDFITQANWVVWHRLTWENDTKVAKRHLGAEYADEIPGLEDGEAFVMRDWEDVISRIQFKRKRTFDAGATPGLDAVERPELRDLGDNLTEELEEISAKQSRREDRIAELESKLDEKQKKIEGLEDELESERNVTSVLERISGRAAEAGGDSSTIEAEVAEIREEKNEEIQALQRERDALEDDLAAAENQIARLEARVEELEEYESAVENMEELREAVVRMNDALGIQTGDGDSELRERLSDARERIDDLESKLQAERQRSGGVDLSEFEAYEEFLELDAVREELQRAREDAPSAPAVETLVSAIVDVGGPVSYDEVAEIMGHSTNSSTRKAASTLEAHNLVDRFDSDDGKMVDLNLDGIEEIQRMQERRERVDALDDKLWGNGE